jgi:hypothetical protein
VVKGHTQDKEGNGGTWQDRSNGLCYSCVFKEWKILNYPTEERKERMRCRLGLVKGSMETVKNVTRCIQVSSYSLYRITSLEFQAPRREQLKLVFHYVCAYCELSFWMYRNLNTDYFIVVAECSVTFGVHYSITADRDWEMKHSVRNQICLAQLLQRLPKCDLVLPHSITDILSFS